jgi:hypothetical protein
MGHPEAGQVIIIHDYNYNILIFQGYVVQSSSLFIASCIDSCYPLHELNNLLQG